MNVVSPSFDVKLVSTASILLNRFNPPPEFHYLEVISDMERYSYRNYNIRVKLLNSLDETNGGETKVDETQDKHQQKMFLTIL